MKNYFLLCIGIGLLLNGGCAWYDMTPISNQDVKNWSKCGKDGYVFYQPELYFAATITQVTTTTNQQTSTKQDVTVTPLYLPNHNEAYRVKTHNFLAKAGYNFAFTDGWKLTQIGDTSDNSTVASSFVGQLSSLVTAAAGAAKLTSSGSKTPTTNIVVFLYKPIYDTNDGTITGFVPRGKMVVVPPTQ